MKISELKTIIKEEIKFILSETGEMSRNDIIDGGEHYEWAKSIENDVKDISDLTNGQVKFVKMNPFDVYQGPYATVTINGTPDKIWSTGENSYFIEKLRMTGDMYDLIDALNGDKRAMKIALKNTKQYE